MASTITQYSNSININFPIPGEDNDSQGFRTNFAKIQSALSVAGGEITNIQLNAVNLSDTNDFGGNIVKRASLQNSSLVVNDAGSVGSSVSVDYSLGSYQKFSVDGGSYTFTVINWPQAGQCGTVRLEITPTSSSAVSISFGGTTYILSKTDMPITYTQTSPIVWELWSPDNGATIYAHELGLPNSVVTGTTIIAAENIKIAKNNYAVKSANSATVVSNNVWKQRAALVPHYIDTTIVEFGCEDHSGNIATSSTNFVVDNIRDITTGSIFWMGAATQTFTVERIEGNTVYTQRFSLDQIQPTGTNVTFVSPRFNQPTTLHLTSNEPTSILGRPYDLKGEVYASHDKLWVAYRDHNGGTGNNDAFNQWVPAATQTGANTFTNYNHFEKPVRLANLTVSQAYAQTNSQDGQMIFLLSGYNRPAYFYNGIWHVLGNAGNALVSGGKIDVNPSRATWRFTI